MSTAAAFLSSTGEEVLTSFDGRRFYTSYPLELEGRVS